MTPVELCATIIKITQVDKSLLFEYNECNLPYLYRQIAINSSFPVNIDIYIYIYIYAL